MKQNKSYSAFPGVSQVCLLIALALLIGCNQGEGPIDKRIKSITPEKAQQLAKAIEATVTPQLAEGLTLSLWGIDSLVADPVSIDIDDAGKLYYTRTNRQKNSEFDIRGHQDWEIESIQLKSIEEKRAFLHKILSPENSKKNAWLTDVNKDGSHDWRDMTIEKEHVCRLEDTDGDGVADLSQLMIEDFHDEVTDAAGGILKHGDDLFVDIGPDMWRLKDTNGDGLIDEKTSISHGYGIHVGFSGHGMSGIEVGPEGKIYWQIGDIGFSGIGPDGQKWEHPNSGVIVRANPDGSDFEVFAYGNRNTHEFVFDEYGNLISEDNDGDHKGESERIVYIVNGSDTGWRTNWQFGKYRDPDNNTYKVWMDEKMYVPRWEGQPAYITPAIKNFVNGPTGMLYNPGTALSEEWNNTFFVVEFVGNPSRSGIHSFKLNPKGATFELGEHKQILGGVLATGIDFGPDGAMYMGDWIDGWDTKDYGRIWKLDVAAGVSDARKQTQTLLKEDLSKYEENKLGDLLKYPDMRVRQKAQFELATRGEKGIAVFQENINQTENQLARVNSIWGISQFARQEIKHAKILVPLLNDSDPEIRAQAAKWIGDVRYKKAGEALIPLLKDEHSRARFFAAEALGRIAYEPAINPIIELLRANNEEDAFIRHAGSLALARIGKAEGVAALSNDPSRAVRIAAVVALRRMSDPSIANFLKDQDEFVITEAARGINDDLSIEQALPALGEVLNDHRFTNEALVRRAISANLRVGTEKSMENLINYANNTGSPVTMRVEVMAALSTWAKPSVLDRVDGRFRGIVTRDPSVVISKSSDVLIQLSANKESSIRIGAIKAIGKLRISKASPQLFARLKTDSQPEVRAEALKALASINDKQIGDAIKQALSDKEKSVRVTALDLLQKMDISKELMVTLLTDVINTRTIEEKQAAITTLGNLPLANSQPVLEGLLVKMENGKLPPETYLELAEAIDSTHSLQLISRYKEINKKLAPDSLMSAYKGSLLGGDVNRGARIFYSNQAAQCVRCHAIGDYGGNAGPRLNGVAERLTREQILESLIDPSARIAAGFGTVSLELTNGKTLNGILQQENKKGLLLKIGDKPDTLIAHESIVKRTYGTSSMPPMRYLLTKKEIRDLVSFLSTLKENN
ncbi:MAG: HEAT repeat domain-containing protein [Bacteroidia bacterium]|nr:HEAT repeat domain-containing protein [Bacteroidia bacterium]